MSWTRVRPWLALGLIFAVGMVTGAALAIGFGIITSHAPSELQIRAHWQGRLNDKLNLTPAQQAQIQPILADASNQIQALHQDEVGQISRIMHSANARIFPLLTPDQQVGLRKMEMERQRDFSGHMRGWGNQRGPQHPGQGMQNGGANHWPNGGPKMGPNGGPTGGPNGSGSPNMGPSGGPNGPPDGGQQGL